MDWLLLFVSHVASEQRRESADQVLLQSRSVWGPAAEGEADQDKRDAVEHIDTEPDVGALLRHSWLRFDV